MADSNEVAIAAVVGAGQMGGGIAQVMAGAECDTLLYDQSADAVSKALATIEKLLGRQVEKEKITASQKQVILSRLKPISSLSEAAKAEADVERFEVKKEVFAQLDAICKPSAILATNTSSISVTRIAAATKRPEKVIGMHFMNPVPVMQLVEVIRGLQTEDAISLTRRLGKVPVTSRRDFPGFVVNRILMPMINEAFFVLMEGIAVPEEVDQAMKLGTNQPMGPLELADFVGLDTCLAICEIFHRELGDDKYRPCPLMAKYVEAGWLGRKTGRGVYKY
jgi:3-hydroxybutyryl-CoA dehydrogenase